MVLSYKLLKLRKYLYPFIIIKAFTLQTSKMFIKLAASPPLSQKVGTEGVHKKRKDEEGFRIPALHVLSAGRSDFEFKKNDIDIE
jgi:hypothetical protein